MKLLTMTTLVLWLALMAVAATAHNPVLDTTGQALERGVGYYIKPLMGGRVTPIMRNDSCPVFVGQEPTFSGQGLPVKFAPFFEDEELVFEDRDFKASFTGATVCAQSMTWQLQGSLIGTGDDHEGYTNYFRISPGELLHTYYISWCPRDACPSCGVLLCGRFGVIVEDDNRLLSWAELAGIPVVFVRADSIAMQ